MGGGRPRASTSARVGGSPFHHSCALPVVPAQAGTTRPNATPTLFPQFIPPSPSERGEDPNSSLPPSSRPSHNPEFRCASITRPDRDDRPTSPNQGVTRRSASRGEVRGGGRPRASTSARAGSGSPFRHSCALPVSSAPLPRHSCAGRNHPPQRQPPPSSPIHPSLPL